VFNSIKAVRDENPRAAWNEFHQPLLTERGFNEETAFNPGRCGFARIRGRTCSDRCKGGAASTRGRGSTRDSRPAIRLDHRLLPLVWRPIRVGSRSLGLSAAARSSLGPRALGPAFRGMGMDSGSLALGRFDDPAKRRRLTG